VTFHSQKSRGRYSLTEIIPKTIRVFYSMTDQYPDEIAYMVQHAHEFADMDVHCPERADEGAPFERDWSDMVECGGERGVAS